MPDVMQASILVFGDVEELDFVGPWEVLKSANKVRPGIVEVKLVAQEKETPIRAFNGLRFFPEVGLASAEIPDLLIVPGGQGRRVAMRDAEILDFVRKTAKAGRMIASVCTGAFVLAEAGLLSGKRATTHGSALDELRGYPDIAVVEERVVRNGNIFTAAGVSAGMDMALEILAIVAGSETALATARHIEYEPPHLLNTIR